MRRGGKKIKDNAGFIQLLSRNITVEITSFEISRERLLDLGTNNALPLYRFMFLKMEHRIMAKTGKSRSNIKIYIYRHR